MLLDGMAVTLLISPESFPWSIAKEDTFILPELAALTERHKLRVVLVPQLMGGSRRPQPFDVVEAFATSAATQSRRSLALRAARSRLLREEVVARPVAISNIRALKRLVHYVGHAEHAREWLDAWVSAHHLEREPVVVETTWWSPFTTGAALLKEKYPRLRVVTRAHGADLYEERHSPAYLPCRASTLRRIDGVFPVSDAGTRWLHERFPSRTRVETFRLGIPDPRVLTHASKDGVLRVVSCSIFVPVKRLGLLISGLEHLKGRGTAVHWTHHGTGGPLEAELKEQAAQRLGKGSVSFTFEPFVDQAKLFDWYAANPIDVVANVSESEGLPVSLMEAAACGVPLLATAVGGNPEICTSSNGLLLSANPTAEEVAKALLQFASPDSIRWRRGSRTVFERGFDAPANHAKWFNMLLTIANQEGA